MITKVTMTMPPKPASIERGVMQPPELAAIIDEVYGNRGQRKLAYDVRRGEVTISRWLSGTTPIGATETVLLRLILALHRARIDWRVWVQHPEESIEDLL